VGSPSAKALLLALANFSDDNGEHCFPGQETLAEITELSLDTIQRQIRFLIEQDFVQARKERRKGRWQSWSYKINLVALADQASPCGTVNQAAECGTVKKDKTAPRGVAKPQDAARPSRTTRPYPSNYPFNEPEGQTRARATRISDDFKTDEETYAWAISQLGSKAAADGSIERFRNYHRQLAGERALSCDWDARFRLWVDDDAKRPRHGRRSENLSQTDPGLAQSGLEDRSRDTIPDAHWDQVLKTYVNTGKWTRHVSAFGGEPGSLSCRVPRHLLVKQGLADDAA
jgi:hypothetical protein